MKKCFCVIYVMVVVLAVSLFAIQAFSQENMKQESAKEGQTQGAASQAPAAPAAPAAAAPAAPAPASAAPAQEAQRVSELSIYGEVQAVNVQTNSITAQYYDYDNDEEKSIEISLDKDTKLENVKAIEEIKKGDWADVTYVAAGGKSMAKSVSIEKEEPAQEENAPAPAEE